MDDVQIHVRLRVVAVRDHGGAGKASRGSYCKSWWREALVMLRQHVGAAIAHEAHFVPGTLERITSGARWRCSPDAFLVLEQVDRLQRIGIVERIGRKLPSAPRRKSRNEGILVSA